tara:strand:- start:14 stop:160 length:147 start_codon:yes stop_codon:yes gene_type:complete
MIRILDAHQHYRNEIFLMRFEQQEVKETGNHKSVVQTKQSNYARREKD